jgi:hypothetical protein
MGKKLRDESNHICLKSRFVLPIDKLRDSGWADGIRVPEIPLKDC